jgi:hypothetical protein
MVALKKNGKLTQAGRRELAKARAKNKKKSSYYPVARSMGLGTNGVAQPNAIVEVPKLLSIVNRRLYRQHGSYKVKLNLNVATSTSIAPIAVYALAPTWWVINSIRKAKQHFDQAMADETEQGGRSRWYDFRIDHNATTATSADAFLGRLDNVQAQYAGGADEYLYSDVRCADGNDRKFSLTGASSLTQYNIFEEYDRMGQTDVTPPSANQGGYTDLIESIDNENVQHLTGDGNAPPYNADDFPDYMWIKVGTLYYDSDGSQRVSTGFFEAPLGYIWLPGYNLGADVETSLSLEVASGGYKGVDFTAY